MMKFLIVLIFLFSLFSCKEEVRLVENSDKGILKDGQSSSENGEYDRGQDQDADIREIEGTILVDLEDEEEESLNDEEFEDGQGVRLSDLFAEEKIVKKIDYSKFVESIYKEDFSCRQVISGNMCGSKPCVEKVSLNYTKVIGKSFLNRICSNEKNNEIKSFLERASMGYQDSLSLRAFSSKATSYNSVENILSTYALIFTLGQRESSGNFLEGRDQTASNTDPLTEEAGVFQYSANSTLGSSEGKVLLRKLMRSYVKTIDQLETPKEMASFCGTDLVGDKTAKGKRYDAKGITLSSEFSLTCRDLLHDKKFEISFPLRYGGRDSFTKTFSSCFKTLQKQCPAFATETASLMVRSSRRHSGPLWSKAEWSRAAELKRKKGHYKTAKFYETFASSKRPYPAPSCRNLFVKLYKEKAHLCKKAYSEEL